MTLLDDLDLDIFERTRRRVAAGKDFPPEMVVELCRAYDELIARTEAAQLPPESDLPEQPS